MAHLTVPDIIDIGDLATYRSGNYIEEGRVYGDRLSQDMNTTIAMITDALRWQWEAFPDVAEVRAVGGVTIDGVGNEGDRITVFVNDPFNGVISLGSYTQSATDTLPSEIAAGLAANMQLNTYGYQVLYSPNSNSITIIGAEGTGALINNANNLIVQIVSTVNFISTETEINIISQNNFNLITEQDA